MASGEIGNADLALATVTTARRTGGTQPWFQGLVPISEIILRESLPKNITKYTSANWKPNESWADFIDYTLTDLLAQEQYESMIEIIKVWNQTLDSKSERRQNLALQRRTLERLVAARRFEEADDALRAVIEYREVVANGGKFIPAKKATEALQRLGQTHPEVFKAYEGILLQGDPVASRPTKRSSADTSSRIKAHYCAYRPGSMSFRPRLVFLLLLAFASHGCRRQSPTDATASPEPAATPFLSERPETTLSPTPTPSPTPRQQLADWMDAYQRFEEFTKNRAEQWPASGLTLTKDGIAKFDRKYCRESANGTPDFGIYAPGTQSWRWVLPKEPPTCSKKAGH